MFDFHVIKGTIAREAIENDRKGIVSVVRDAYLAHHAQDSVNPDSYFLRFPEKPDSRIIALPAYLGGTSDVAGVKWVSSFPQNIEESIPRASAALLLNDYRTGYPFACLEASQISAARTAASAVLAAAELLGSRTGRLAVVGAGIISRNILEFFRAEGWDLAHCTVHDRNPDYAAALVDFVESELGYRASVAEDRAAAGADADVVVLATTAGVPYITDPDEFRPGQVVLNISLRDLSPRVIAASVNVVDDVEHCLKADTSPHLTEQELGHRDFIAGTLAQVIAGEVDIDRSRTVVFSPFGLGILDLAVGLSIYRTAIADGSATEIEDFFAEKRRW